MLDRNQFNLTDKEIEEIEFEVSKYADMSDFTPVGEWLHEKGNTFRNGNTSDISKTGTN